MFEILIKELKEQHDGLVRKIPSLEESYRNYAGLAKNYKKELEEAENRAKSYRLLIACLEEGVLNEAMAQRISNGLAKDADPKSVEGVLRDSFVTSN